MVSNGRTNDRSQKEQGLSCTENEEVNFHRGWPSREKLFGFVVVVVLFCFSRTENHTSLPKEDELVQARKLNLRTDGDGKRRCLTALLHQYHN